MWFLTAVIVCTVCMEFYYAEFLDFPYFYRRNMPKEPNYNESFFSSLENYEVNASDVTEDKYPWIARVVHSKTYTHPYMCSAACIEDRVFITAGRCVYSLKVPYTTVVYQNHYLSVKAFVVPSKKSKQAFDDVGFIVVNEEGFQGQWATIPLFDNTNRTDENFDWFGNLNLPEDTSEHIVVGYATQKSMKNIYLANENQYKLKELEVVVNINICPEILIYNKLIKGFHVPCYHSCNVQQFKIKNPKCLNYHGVLGASVVNTKTNKLLGIATWGPSFVKYELPVGVTVPNSKSFFEDLTCARRIKLDMGSLVINGYYQALCEDIN